MRTWVQYLAVLLLGLAVFALQAQQDSSRRHQPNKMTAAQNESKSDVVRAATDDPSYVISWGDVLDIDAWKEPEIYRTVQVRHDGKISLTLVNDVQAAELTPMKLGVLLTEKLRKYPADPLVLVIVTAINSRQIYFLGEVNRAGTYALLPGLTVLQVLSNAGDFTQFASEKNIVILRTKKQKTGVLLVQPSRIVS